MLQAAVGAAVIAYLTYRSHLRRTRERHACELESSLTPSRLEALETTALQTSSDEILALLKKRTPVLVDGMDPALHYIAPHVPKVKWAALGDLVAARERSTSGSVEGSRWISLRLDGCGFSKAVRLMRKNGVLEGQGHSMTFAEAMVSSLRLLMEHFHGVLGYTQSDEMVLFIRPASIVRGAQQAHARNGRVTKITTLAASLATAHFVMVLSGRCLTSGLGLDGLAQVLPHFDCRMGSYASWEEARSLLLWRAYDCSVNGVSDAVYHIKGSGKAVQGLGQREKVTWLWEHSHLPLPRHQAYGTLLVKVRRTVVGHNPKTGTTATTLRGNIERVDGPVLELARTEALFPKDDEL
eukprot:CAMPEP_0174710474 /NCGR_PEP_ID=MMETSP1094-20130205/12100_1 /TAXON_ID=156173 /ORGANISM="Chrysochromulina brevifilum, Strain UTEX LB 985" /LENGTH=352 /DNA_ID=CAMNT_0015909287 /DNA_START=17 /DNA_END=1075 /DNA_ORIENTATION=-